MIQRETEGTEINAILRRCADGTKSDGDISYRFLITIFEVNTLYINC